MSVGSVREHVPTFSFAAFGGWGAEPPTGCLEAIGFLSVETRVELLRLRAPLRERHHRDAEHDRERDEARHLPAAARDESQRTERRGQAVDQENSRLVRETDVAPQAADVAPVPP